MHSRRVTTFTSRRDDHSSDPSSQLMAVSSSYKDDRKSEILSDFPGRLCNTECPPCAPTTLALTSVRGGAFISDEASAKLANFAIHSSDIGNITDVKVDILEGEELYMLADGYARKYTTSANSNIMPFGVYYIYNSFRDAPFVEHVDAVNISQGDITLKFRGKPASKTNRVEVLNLFTDERDFSMKEKVKNALIGLAQIHDRGYIHTFINDLTVHMNGTASEVQIQRLDKLLKVGKDGCTAATDRLGVNSVYTSPEVYHRTVISQKSDIYSLGMVFLNYLTGGTCQRNIREDAKQHLGDADRIGLNWFVGVKTHINNMKARRFSLSQNYGFDVEGLLSDMLSIHPSERLSAKKLLKRYFRGEYSFTTSKDVGASVDLFSTNKLTKIFANCARIITDFDLPMLTLAGQLAVKLEIVLGLKDSTIFEDQSVSGFIASLTSFLIHRYSVNGEKTCKYKSSSDYPRWWTLAAALSS